MPKREKNIDEANNIVLEVVRHDQYLGKIEGVLAGLDYLRAEAKRLGDEDVTVLMDSVFNIMMAIYKTNLKCKEFKNRHVSF